VAGEYGAIAIYTGEEVGESEKRKWMERQTVAGLCVCSERRARVCVCSGGACLFWKMWKMEKTDRRTCRHVALAQRQFTPGDGQCRWSSPLLPIHTYSGESRPAPVASGRCCVCEWGRSGHRQKELKVSHQRRHRDTPSCPSGQQQTLGSVAVSTISDCYLQWRLAAGAGRER
jgi:hypothetical protein